MSKVNVRYYGHACFRVSTESGSVVFDPYKNDTVPGVDLPAGITADAVYCSHQHGDHNAAELITLTGKDTTFPVSFITVPHDHEGGSKRGLCQAAFVEMDGLTVAHLGDLGRMPTEEEYEKMRTADVVMIPCGGFYTISSAEAAEILKNLKRPSVKILMHFRDGEKGYDVIESIRDVMKTIPGVKRLDVSEIEIDPANVPDEIITLVPEQ